MKFLANTTSEQLDLVSGQTALGVPTQILVIALTSYLIAERVDVNVLIWWCAAHAVSLAWYSAIPYWRAKDAIKKRPPQYWAALYMMGTTINGIIWGSSLAIFHFNHSPESTFFFISVLFGIAGGSILTVGSVFPLFASVLIPLIGLPTIWVIQHHDEMQVQSGYALLMLIGLIFLLVTGRFHSKHIESAIRQNRALRLSDQRFRDVSDAAGEYLWEIDSSLIYTYVSEKSLAVKCYSPEELLGHTPMEFMLIEESMEFSNEAHRAMADKTAFNFQHRNICMDGQIRWEEVSGIPIQDENGRVIGLRGTGLNITDKKNSEEIIWKQANFDSLTQLPNRRLFNDRLEQALNSALRNNFQLAVLFLDLDNFKEVNDSLGHKAGDALLLEVAKRTTSCIRAQDTVAHFGGDEFTIILADLQDGSHAGAVAQKIITELSGPIHLNDEVVHISASIGITLFPADGLHAEQLLMNADQAMYLAKTSGRNQFQYFTPALQTSAREKKRLISDLRNALSNNQLMIYFQPIIDMSSGRIHKAEALARWKHPVRGMVSPALWIPLAEETGLIDPIGDWIFQEAVRQAALWKKMHPDFEMGINISPVQFTGITCDQNCWMATHIKNAGLTGSSVVLEITEGLMLDADEEIKSKLNRIKDADIKLSLDDFGTGYSSLSYLNKFNFDYLKIDQSFVRNMENDASNIALSKAIIVMAHSLNLRVVAEGIETEHQRDLLAEMGCDYGQGYWWSKPMPAEEFELYLIKSTSDQVQTM